MINAAIDNYQTNLKHAFHDDISELNHGDVSDEDQDPDLTDEVEINHETLMEMIQELPDGYRVVFNLYAIENYSHKDIAGMLGISENTSKTQLMKARKSLKNKIEALLQPHHINEG